MGIACFPRAKPAEKAGHQAYRRVAEILQWRKGEIKWRKALRASRRLNVNPCGLTSVIREHAAYVGSDEMHIENVASARLELAARVIRGAAARLGGIGLLILDHGLLPGDSRSVGRLRRLAGMASLKVLFRSSGRVPGIQLADIIAGARCSCRGR